MNTYSLFCRYNKFCCTRRIFARIQYNANMKPTMSQNTHCMFANLNSHLDSLLQMLFLCTRNTFQKFRQILCVRRAIGVRQAAGQSPRLGRARFRKPSCLASAAHFNLYISYFLLTKFSAKFSIFPDGPVKSFSSK